MWLWTRHSGHFLPGGQHINSTAVYKVVVDSGHSELLCWFNRHQPVITTSKFPSSWLVLVKLGPFWLGLIVHFSGVEGPDWSHKITMRSYDQYLPSEWYPNVTVTNITCSSLSPGGTIFIVKPANIVQLCVYIFKICCVEFKIIIDLFPGLIIRLLMYLQIPSDD